jgi:hypothetical protein
VGENRRKLSGKIEFTQRTAWEELKREVHRVFDTLRRWGSNLRLLRRSTGHDASAFSFRPRWMGNLNRLERFLLQTSPQPS